MNSDWDKMKFVMTVVTMVGTLGFGVFTTLTQPKVGAAMSEAAPTNEWVLRAESAVGSPPSLVGSDTRFVSGHSGSLFIQYGSFGHDH